ncbi:hypothetical protein [Streptomyces sp. SID12488]|uniref:hypothetical protein n=1 Tax=Streptomyces sp. SID12488 TaxID=2706040 RepID=UPI0013DC267C|nr:hypothetical protein [Streptomyces sp. SID12488]NEA65306.1 hypothetical protein [Streptomyces sp. SID12488]
MVIEDWMKGADVTIQMVPTLLRTIFVSEQGCAEYEFEGWLLGDYPERIWVQGQLRTGGEPGVVDEGSIRRLVAHEEIGTDPFFPELNPETYSYELPNS